MMADGKYFVGASCTPCHNLKTKTYYKKYTKKKNKYEHVIADFKPKKGINEDLVFDSDSDEISDN